MIRRSFFGSLVALALAPFARWLPLRKLEGDGRCIAFLFRSDTPGISHEELREWVRDCIKPHLPCYVRLPCGTTIGYETLDAIPLHDVPCPCGDPNHWLVKWEIPTP